MLGHLLEFSITARPIASALEFYRALGCAELPTGDGLATPYAVVWDGHVVYGLHEREFDGPALSFVRPNLKDHLRGLRHLGIECEYAHLADDEFNEAGFLDPNGQLVRLLEARTFSSAVWQTSSVPVCGEFLEYSLATHSLEEARAFWGRLGLEEVAAGDEPHAWIRMQAHGLSLGLHETAAFRAALSFSADNLSARIEYMKARGLGVTRGAPLAVAGRQAATLPARGELALFLLEAGGH